jgi:hypothetical protein
MGDIIPEERMSPETARMLLRDIMNKDGCPFYKAIGSCIDCPAHQYPTCLIRASIKEE